MVFPSLRSKLPTLLRTACVSAPSVLRNDPPLFLKIYVVYETNLTSLHQWRSFFPSRPLQRKSKPAPKVPPQPAEDAEIKIPEDEVSEIQDAQPKDVKSVILARLHSRSNAALVSEEYEDKHFQNAIFLYKPENLKTKLMHDGREEVHVCMGDEFLLKEGRDKGSYEMVELLQRCTVETIAIAQHWSDTHRKTIKNSKSAEKYKEAVKDHNGEEMSKLKKPKG